MPDLRLSRLVLQARDLHARKTDYRVNWGDSGGTVVIGLVLAMWDERAARDVVYFSVTNGHPAWHCSLPGYLNETDSQKSELAPDVASKPAGVDEKNSTCHVFPL